VRIRRCPSRRSSGRSPRKSNGAGGDPDPQEEARIAEPKKDLTRINERIRAREIRVIGAEGEQLGIMTPDDARQRATEQGLDLVEVSPNANPPVCRIMDYGKYKYEQKKKKAAGKQKGKGHVASLKEIKVRPRTDQHDLEFKLRSARRFLMEGDKVKVTVQFRGREIVHAEKGRDQLDRVKQMIGALATMEAPPRMEGRFMSMILVPNRDAVAAAARAEAAAARAAEGTTESEDAQASAGE
jgi:translation initiation factor IF-3